MLASVSIGQQGPNIFAFQVKAISDFFDGLASTMTFDHLFYKHA
jgi:hypothetical protein